MSTSSRPLALAFLGCGAITERHSRTLRSMGADVRLHYASRDASKADAFRRRFGGSGAHGSYAAAWSDPAVDVVLVATPPHLHLDQTLAALRAGKHVILEKPAFLSADGFAPVREAAARAGRSVLVAENYVYKPLVSALRDILRRGDIGEPLLVLVDAAKRQRPTGWRADPVLSGGGGLLEGGIHWVSFMASLGLEPRRVTGHRAGTPRTPTEETVLAVFEYEGGAVGALSFSWEVPSPLKGVRLSRIYGREGTVRFESNGLFVWVQGRRAAFRLPGLRDLSGHRAMFHDFFDALRDGREPLMTLDLAERDLRLVSSIYASMEGR
ncbi:MAG TPA: Gfo/Idh/MocA family oxidoreductase [Longimicrobiales bacterium]|nr:Gfo/Idh/MocA family oxidoreductase [Longimicrobiales bacterium]